MDKKIKISNVNNYDVGVKLMNGLEVNIKPGSFYMMAADDIYYIATLCDLFKSGILIINDNDINEELDIKIDANNILTDKAIRKLLIGGFDEMKSAFDKVDSPSIQYKIFDMARNVYDDLSGKQINYLSKLCNKEPNEFYNENTIDLNKDEVIESLLKGNFMKMKSGIGKLDSDEDKELIYNVAIKLKDLSQGVKDFVSKHCEKEIK